MDKSLIIILVQVVIIFAVVLIVTLFLRLNNAFKLEKRIAKYSVRYDKEKSNESLIDKVWHKYISFVKKQRKKIRKMLPWLTSKYDKYSVGSEYKAEDFITHKIVISLLFLLLTFISVNIQGKLITMLQIIFSLAH